MVSSPTCRDGENTGADAEGTSTVARPGFAPREGQLLQQIASLQTQLSAISRREEELVGLVGALRGQLEG